MGWIKNLIGCLGILAMIFSVSYVASFGWHTAKETAQLRTELKLIDRLIERNKENK